MRTVRLLALAVLLLPCAVLAADTAIAVTTVAASPAPAPGARIAIIIDDIGYRWRDDQRVLELPAAVAVSILPHSPHGARLADAAHRQGRPVLLHLPMAAAHGNAALLGPAPLTPSMDRAALQQTLAAALASVPHARGVNNHMGSLLTTQPGPMRWLMQSLQCYRDLYFIDSFTTADSVALATAWAHGLRANRRHVFLDHDDDELAIAGAFDRLIRRAHRDGAALAIGHPERTTIDVLQRLLPKLAERGVTLVAPDQLLQRQARHCAPAAAC